MGFTPLFYRFEMNQVTKRFVFLHVWRLSLLLFESSTTSSDIKVYPEGRLSIVVRLCVDKALLSTVAYADISRERVSFTRIRSWRSLAKLSFPLLPESYHVGESTVSAVRFDSA